MGSDEINVVGNNIEIRDMKNHMIEFDNRLMKLEENNHGGVTVQETATGDEEIITTAYNSKAVRDLADKINKDPRYHMVAPDGKQWIDLDIDNLPSRFFTRDDIEIEWLHSDKWCIANESRSIMISNVLNYKIKYRYRLKPLESIKINDLMFKTLMSYHGGIGLSKQERLDDLEERYGNKVEIIK
jgi:hypothetical protein